MLLDQVYYGKLNRRFPLYAAGGNTQGSNKESTFSIFSLHRGVNKSVILIVCVFHDLFLQLGIQIYSHFLFFQLLIQTTLNSSSGVLSSYILNGQGQQAKVTSSALTLQRRRGPEG